MDDRGTPDFQTIVAHLDDRARHLIARETRLGQSSHVLSQVSDGRIGADELQERVLKLSKRLDALDGEYHELVEALPDEPDRYALAAIDEIAKPWPKTTTSRRSVDKIEDRLYRTWESLGDLLGHVVRLERAVRYRIGGDDLDMFHGLAPTEIEALLDDEDEPERSGEAAQHLISSLRLADGLRHAISETRALIAGHFHGEPRRGRYNQVRGKRLISELIGMAEGLGLTPTRNRDPSDGGTSAADAVAAVVKRLRATVFEGAAGALVRDVQTKNYLTIETITLKSNPDSPRNAELASYRSVGRTLGRRLRDGN